jgi:hypothetical protein
VLTVLALAAPLCLAAPATAETITTTDGMRYTRAADGHYYPSPHVTAAGAVVLTPAAVRPAAPYLPSHAPQHLPAYPFPQSNCPNGKCPLK